MKKLLALFAAVATLGLATPVFACGMEGCTCQKADDKQAADDSANDDAEVTAEATLRIEGMSCGKCASHLASTLEEVEGIVEADVSFDDDEATVRYDADQVEPDSLVDTVEETHDNKFDAELLSQAPIQS